MDQDRLVSIKAATNDLERSLSVGGKRTVNLDPGYITPAKLVLATTKDYCHRIYLGEGIFAEVTLIFRKGRFTPHLNTYRDYRDEGNIVLFGIARTMLLRSEGLCT